MTAPTKRVTVADMAHIIAASVEGPRGTASLSEDERAEFENLLLLCPSCHRLVDQASESYPVGQLRQWKDDIRIGVVRAVAIEKLGTRGELRGAIAPLLRSNRAVWATYGPDARAHDDPAGDSANIWQRKVREIILPNNILVLAALDINSELLRPEELNTLEELRAHVDDLVARHLHGVIELGGSRFPIRMDALLLETGNQ